MAYKNSRRSRPSRAGSYRRSRPARRAGSARRASRATRSRRGYGAARTVRIVIEQPAGTGAARPEVMGLMERAPRRARF